MKIKEILGENMPELMPATVVNASNTEVTYKQDPKNPASPEIKVPIKPDPIRQPLDTRMWLLRSMEL
ncbi:MAG: hypothetical protein EBU51_00685 [Synechococcaceae bacterium WB6_3A_227]|nr:hypothetical protein [Synechococcaceae bacterium WB6_3A_227]